MLRRRRRQGSDVLGSAARRNPAAASGLRWPAGGTEATGFGGGRVRGAPGAGRARRAARGPCSSACGGAGGRRGEGGDREKSERDGDRARLRQGRGLGLRGRPSGEGNVEQRPGLVACGCWASSLSPSYFFSRKELERRKEREG